VTRISPSGERPAGTGPLPLVAYILIAVFFFQDREDLVSRALSLGVIAAAGIPLGHIVWTRWLKPRLPRSD